MKKKSASITSLALSFLLIAFTLSACGASSSSNGSIADTAPAAPGYDMAASEESYDSDKSAGEYGFDGEYDSVVQTSEAEKPLDQKLIYRVYLDIETLEYDSSITLLESMCTEYGGYIENASVAGNRLNGSSLRWADYILRIPSEKLDEFESACGDVGNVYNSTRQTENATASYVDLEARLKSYKAEEERLLELVAQAVDLESIIALNSRLSEVRYEIESIESGMRGIDSLVSYSTVYVTLSEVVEETETTVIPKTFSERVSSAASNSMKNFKATMQDIGVFLIGEAPIALLMILIYLLPLIIIALVVLLLIRRVKRKKAARYERLAQENNKQNNKEEDQ